MATAFQDTTGTVILSWPRKSWREESLTWEVRVKRSLWVYVCLGALLGGSGTESPIILTRRNEGRGLLPLAPGLLKGASLESSWDTWGLFLASEKPRGLVPGSSDGPERLMIRGRGLYLEGSCPPSPVAWTQEIVCGVRDGNLGPPVF